MLVVTWSRCAAPAALVWRSLSGLLVVVVTATMLLIVVALGFGVVRALLVGPELAPVVVVLGLSGIIMLELDESIT